MPVVDQLLRLLGAKAHGTALVLQELANAATCWDVGQAHQGLGYSDCALDCRSGNVFAPAFQAARGRVKAHVCVAHGLGLGRWCAGCALAKAQLVIRQGTCVIRHCLLFPARVTRYAASVKTRGNNTQPYAGRRAIVVTGGLEKCLEFHKEKRLF